jgi:uncharacterized membrane protein YhfC
LTALTVFSYLISGFLEITIPLVIAYFFIKRLDTSWKIWFIGALMFLISLVRIPLNSFLTNWVVSIDFSYYSYILIYLVPSITAGIFEETARYIGLRYLVKDNSYKKGLTYGAGHGGIESIFVVGINVFTIGILLLINSDSIPQIDLEYIASLPWYLPFIGLYERIMAMAIQISLSIMVLETLRTRLVRYFFLAVLLHIAVDYISVSVVGYNILYAELVVTGFAIGLSYWALSKISDAIMV